MELKKCPKCKVPKSRDRDFWKSGRYEQAYCKECSRRVFKAYSSANPDKIKQYKATDLAKLRSRVDALLGRVCKKCGFDDERALAIDHVFDDGAKERRKSAKSQYNLFRRVLGNPERYQRLCFNCNTIKEAERRAAQDTKH